MTENENELDIKNTQAEAAEPRAEEETTPAGELEAKMSEAAAAAEEPATGEVLTSEETAPETEPTIGESAAIAEEPEEQQEQQEEEPVPATTAVDPSGPVEERIPEAALVLSGPEELAPVPTPENGAAPKKSNKRLAVIVAGAAAVVVVIGLVVGIAVNNTPQNAVLRALAKTAEESIKADEALYRDIPALDPIDGTQPIRYDFDLSFEGADLGDEAMTSMASLFRGLGIRGTTVSVPEKKIVELDGGLYIGSTDLLSAYLYLSPENAAFSVPVFTDTVLAVHSDTLAEELENSQFRSMIDRQTALTVQNSLLEMMNTDMGLDAKEASTVIQKELIMLLQRDVPGLTFAKGPVQDGHKTYLVTAPGDQMKTFFLDVVYYMWMQSPLEPTYRQSFAPLLEQSGMTYEEYVELSFATLQKNLSEQMLEGIVTVEKGRASKIEVTLTPGGIGSSELDFKGMTATYELPGGADTKLALSMDVVMRGDRVNVALTYDGARGEDKGYHAAMELRLDGETTKAAVNAALDYTLDGGVKQNILYQTDTNFGPVVMGLDMTGTVTRGTGDVLKTYDWPKLDVKLGMFGEEYTLNLKANAEALSIPVDTPPSREHTFLSEMSDAQEQQVLAEYNAGINQLMGLIYGSLGR